VDSELAEPEEQERQAKHRQHPASEDHEICSHLQHGVDLRLRQRGDKESGFVGPLADQVAVVCILGQEIFGARSGDVVFVAGQDAALGEAVPAAGGRDAVNRGYDFFRGRGAWGEP
jgi:hypothetical protein